MYDLRIPGYTVDKKAYGARLSKSTKNATFDVYASTERFKHNKYLCTMHSFTAVKRIIKRIVQSSTDYVSVQVIIKEHEPAVQWSIAYRITPL